MAIGRSSMRCKRRVLLIGLGPTSLSALETLAESHEVVGLVRERCSEGAETDEAVAKAAHLGLEVYTDTTLAGIDGLVTSLRPQCVVVSSHHRIFPPDLLRKSRF